MARSRWSRPAWLRGLVAAVVVALVASLVPAAPAGASTFKPSIDAGSAPLACDGDRVAFKFPNGTPRYWRARVPAGEVVTLTLKYRQASDGWLNLESEDLTNGDTAGWDFYDTPPPHWRSGQVTWPGDGTNEFDEVHEVVFELTGSFSGFAGVVGIEISGDLPSLLECRVDQLLGAGESHGTSGDPVNTASGNLADERVDVESRPGTTGPEAARFYNSQDPGSGLFGRGWTASYEATLEQVLENDPSTDDSLPPGESDVLFKDETGRRSEFVYDEGTGTWISPPGVEAVLSYPDNGTAPDGPYQLQWVQSGDRWIFDAQPSGGNEHRLVQVVRASDETIDLTWSNDGATPAEELLYASSSADPTVLRWLDHDSDSIVDEVWVDSPAATENDPTVNYFYEDEGSAKSLHDVTIVHTDASSGAEPWGAGDQCHPPYPCETYQSEDPRIPATSDFPWITRIVDPTGVEVLENGYEFRGPHRVTVGSGVSAGTWWPTVDDLETPDVPEVGRSHYVFFDDGSGSTSGTFDVEVDDDGDPETFSWDATVEGLETFLGSKVAGTIVEGVEPLDDQDGWYRIIWGDDAPHTFALTDTVNNATLSDHVDIAWNDNVASLQPILDVIMPGATITNPGSSTRLFDINWPTTHAHGLVITTDGVTGGTITASVLDTPAPRNLRVSSQQFPSGDTVSFTYDLTSSFLYGPSDSLQAAWDTTVTFDDGVSSETVTYHHDAHGQLVGITDPRAGEIETTYDDGQLDYFEDRRGGQVDATYDTLGRIVQRSWPDPDGAGAAYASSSEYFAYMAADDSRPLITVDTAGTTTTYDYAAHATGDDPDDRVPSRVMVCGLREDPSNGLTTADACEHGAAGTETTAITSSDGLVNQLTDPDGVVSTYHYGSEGGYTGCSGRQLCSETSAGVTTTYTYDPATGQVGSATTQGAGTTSYLYDRAGPPHRGPRPPV